MIDDRYTELDFYLQTVLNLLEGMKDIHGSYAILHTYLGEHRQQLPEELEEFLLELFFDKCRREYLGADASISARC